MLKFLSLPLSVALLVGIFYASLTAIPSTPILALYTFLYEQSRLVLLKSFLESFSFSYWKEVESNFNPSNYSDDPNEQWTVPNYFTYPPGGTIATCQSVDGGIGCTVWNLRNNIKDLNDPCPLVVPYTPTPPLYIYPTVEGSVVKNSYASLVNDLNNGLFIYQATVSGSLSVSDAHPITSPTVTYTVPYTISYSFDSPYLEGGEIFNGAAKFYVTERERQATAECVCTFQWGTITVAEYPMDEVYLNMRGLLDGAELLDESSRTIIKYFTGRKTLIDLNEETSNPISCRMVIP